MVVISHDVQSVDSKERKDRDVGDVHMVEFDLIAHVAIFDDEPALPRDPNVKPNGDTNAA